MRNTSEEARFQLCRRLGSRQRAAQERREACRPILPAGTIATDRPAAARALSVPRCRCGEDSGHGRILAKRCAAR